MTEAQLFRTYLVTWPSKAAQIEELGIEGEWHFTIKDDPSFRHWVNSAGDESGRSTLFKEITNERIKKQELSQVRGKEILIESEEKETAENVASLIQIGTLLGYPNMQDAPERSGADEVKEEIEKFMRGEPFCNWFTFQENALYGCKVAVAAWADPALRYAIEKYMLSLDLDSITPHSASPRHGQIFHNKFTEYSYHVGAATTVFLAYSVIEELGLEIRSSSKEPRFLDNERGEWNPVVKEDTEQRLRDRGIDLSESIHWIYRGEPSTLEQTIKPQLGLPAEYANGDIIRDREMEVIDAIHKASYIRNFIVAHKYSERVSDLGPYDVHNIQLLARRLILSSLGLYRKDDE